MKLSMWTLMDELKDYNPEPEIRNGARCLQSARLFTENMRYSSQNTRVGSLSLLQRVFLTQESNWSPLHCRQILYQLRHKGSPRTLEWVAYSFSSGSS